MAVWAPVSGLASLARLYFALQPTALLGAAIALQYSGKRADVYSILWALVFGFATLNILSLVARRFEPNRNRMNFGEAIAVMTVVVSVFLLGWEMLNLFKIFPLRLHSH
jgi:hypothetical protein